jgi:dipeptidyl aminopeptidase/acylaminoacyl peptidase
MNLQVYVVHPDGTGVRRLSKGGKTNNWLGHWSRDGRFILFSSNDRDPACLEGIIMDVQTGEEKRAGKASGVGTNDDISSDGKFSLFLNTPQRSCSDLFLINIATGGQQLLTPHEGPGDIFQARFSPDGSEVYLSTNLDSDFVRLARMKLGPMGRPGPMEVIAQRADCDLEMFEVSEDGQIAALMWNVAGRNEMDIIDLHSGKIHRGPRLPAEVAYYSGITFSHSGKIMAASFTGATKPVDVWVLDLGEDRFRQLSSSPHAGIRLEELVSPELLTFKAEDGLPLSGWLYRPRGTTSAGPVVVSFHGGPEGQERPYIDAAYQALLLQGISVFAPNVRGSSGFGKTFLNLDNGPLRVNAIRDIRSCVKAVIDAGVANPHRIGVMGGSYGGYMTMAALTEFPDLFAAGADLFGIVNFETFFAHSEPWMAAISKIEYGDPDTQLDLLRALSPIHKIDRVKAPTLVLHGANDTNVPLIEAQQVEAELRRRGVTVELVVFPDEGHGFRKTPNRIRATKEVVRWFNRYLKGSS